MPRFARSSLLLAAGMMLAAAAPVEAQFISPLPRADTPCTAESLQAITNADVREETSTMCREVFARARVENGQIWFFPGSRGRLYAQALYKHAEFGVLQNIDLHFRDDQILVVTEAASGLIGSGPVRISAAFVKTEEQEGGGDTGGTGGTGTTSREEADARSKLTALARNGGSFAVQYAVPLLLSWGPNWRTTFSVAGELGLSGDITDPDNVDPSWSASVDGAFGFTIRNTDDEIQATILAPVRIGRVGVFGGIDEAVLPGDKAFSLLQLGFGLTDAGQNLTGAVLFNWPFDEDVRDRMPRFMINLQAALGGGGGDS